MSRTTYDDFDGTYRCTDCEEFLEREHVWNVTFLHHKNIRIEYACWCSPDEKQAAMYEFEPTLLVNLLGAAEPLPWFNTDPVYPVLHHDPALERARFLLDVEIETLEDIDLRFPGWGSITEPVETEDDDEEE